MISCSLMDTGNFVFLIWCGVIYSLPSFVYGEWHLLLAWILIDWTYVFFFYLFPKIVRDRHCCVFRTCLFALLASFCSPDMEIMRGSSIYLSFLVNMSSRVGNANPRCHFYLHLFYNTARLYWYNIISSRKTPDCRHPWSHCLLYVWIRHYSRIRRETD